MVKAVSFRRMRSVGDSGPRRCGIVGIATVLASCAFVTRTSSLESDPGRSWIRESAGSSIVVQSAGGAETSGTLVDAAAGVVRLQATDSTPIEIATAPGTNLRERRRGTGALLGVLAGVLIGGITGFAVGAERRLELRADASA
jgi:hypothetical protein